MAYCFIWRTFSLIITIFIQDPSSHINFKRIEYNLVSIFNERRFIAERFYRYWNTSWGSFWYLSTATCTDIWPCVCEYECRFTAAVGGWLSNSSCINLRTFFTFSCWWYLTILQGFFSISSKILWTSVSYFEK